MLIFVWFSILPFTAAKDEHLDLTVLGILDVSLFLNSCVKVHLGLLVRLIFDRWKQNHTKMRIAHHLNTLRFFGYVLKTKLRQKSFYM